MILSTVLSLICVGPSFQKMTNHFLLHGSLWPNDLEKKTEAYLSKDSLRVIQHFREPANNLVITDFCQYSVIMALLPGYLEQLRPTVKRTELVPAFSSENNNNSKHFQQFDNIYYFIATSKNVQNGHSQKDQKLVFRPIIAQCRSKVLRMLQRPGF